MLTALTGGSPAGRSPDTDTSAGREEHPPISQRPTLQSVAYFAVPPKASRPHLAMTSSTPRDQNALFRLTAYLRHLGFWHGLRLILARVVTKTATPGADLTWGGLGEDVLLWFYFTEVLSFRDQGFYVDVGCNHPVKHSNTYRFYQLGWRGIAIDADETLISEYAKVRPRDAAVSALVSDQEKELSFHVFEGTQVSTVDDDSLKQWRDRQQVIEVRKLRSKTLNAILAEQQCPQIFELLKIDVEGHDTAVLRSIDLEQFRPSIVMIEIHSHTVESVVETEIYKILSSHNYQMVSLAGYNGIFIRR
jgi:FkbM family methyltransferase